MELVVVLMFIWLIILQSKTQDYEKAINLLNKKIDKLTSKLNCTNIKTEKINTIENVSIEEESYEEESYEEDNDDEYIIDEEITKETNNQKIVHKNSLENFFLGNAFTIIGAIALIIAVGIFIKLISPFFIFTPLMKTIIGFIFGFGLIGTSYAIKKDSLKHYSEIILGTGFSTLFITTLCTTVLFKTFSPTVCAIIGGIILLMAYIVADKQKTISMISIALIGGYFNIAFVPDISINWAFGYIIFLNLLSLIYVFRNSKMEWINITNLVITLFLAITVMFSNGKVNDINIAYPIILWAIYLIYDLLKTTKSENINEFNLLNWINLGILTIFSLIIFENEKIYIGTTLVIIAIIYNIIVGYFMMKNSEKFKPYLYSLLITIFLSVYFLAEDVTRIAIWSLIGFVIALIVGKLKKDYLAKWTLVFFVPTVTNIFFIDGITNNLTSYTPILNDRLLTFSFPIFATIGAFLLTKNSTNINITKTSENIKFIAISLIYLYLVFEINNYINANSLLRNSMQALPYVIIGFIYTLQMKKISISNNQAIFNFASYIIGTISLALLLICGMKYYPISSFVPVCNIRFVAYLTAIGSCIFFAKWTKLEFFKYLATILGFGLITVEAFDFINKINNNNINYIVSIIWLLYAGTITTIGILKNQSYLKNIGIIASILTLCRIFIYDLENVDAIYKLIIFIVLGTIFMVVSYLYNKNKK